MKILRSASAVRTEQVKRRRSSKTESADREMARAIEAIDKAQSEGKSSAWTLSIPDGVVRKLKYKGYKVTFHRACGMGDMDSHEISWSK